MYTIHKYEFPIQKFINQKIKYHGHQKINLKKKNTDQQKN